MMDINLPLILFFLVAGTGVVWVYDFFVLRKPRQAALKAVDDKFPGLSEDEKDNNDEYINAYINAAKEPAVVEYSKSFFPILAVVFVLRSFIIEPFQIPSGSMIPTLEVGDYIAVNKFSYGIRLPVVRTKVLSLGEPKRGDVVVFFPPGETRYFIKRLVGLPGDKVSYVDNQLYINGEAMEQKPIDHVTHNAEEKSAYCSGFFSKYMVVEGTIDDKSHLMQKCGHPSVLSRKGNWEVPEGHYFMMGDNRDNSSDSRAWGFVPEENLVGKAFAVWLHWDKISSVPSFSRAGFIE